MKIGILTQSLRNNYGGLLQNYALQRVLFEAGHDPITFDQGPKNVSIIRKYLFYLKKYLLYKANPSKYSRPLCILNKKEEAIIRKNTLYFINKYIKHTIVLKSLEEIEKESKVRKIEGFVVGSDQCWRASYNYHFPAMFLSFASNVKKIAYAASFGIDKWELSEKATNAYRQWVKDFNLVTVREDSGVIVCKQSLGVDNAIHVLDPTMLLTKQNYIDLIMAENEQKSEGELFYYILDPSEVKSKFISKISNETGYRSFIVLPKYKEEYCTYYNLKHNIEDCIYPSVTKWLRAFFDAKMVIVDSFHGTVFSILFNKPFWVILNDKRGNTRFTSLLTMFGLEDRLVSENDLKSLNYNKPICWERVNSILEEKRLFSTNLLLDTLKI